MNKPKIELRKLSHAKSLSEETPAYSAQIWVDGVYFCDVTNHGHGGPDDYYSRRTAKIYDEVKMLNERIAATFPKFGQEMDRKGFDRDLEVVCHELIDEIEVRKDLQRLLKRTVAFVDPARKGVQCYRGKVEGVQRAHLITETLRKVPGATILNNMPFDDALAVFRAQ